MAARADRTVGYRLACLVASCIVPVWLAAGWLVGKVLLLLYGIENLSVSTQVQRLIMTCSTLIFLAAVALSAGL